MRKLSLLAAFAMIFAWTAAAQAQQISGDYIETRSADVYTGACVANGEVGLVGDQAILAWRVNKGSWNGVALDGLSVIGVVKAGATLGDQFSNPYPAKTVMVVDEKATPEQRAALVSFAREMGGKLLENVVRVDVSPIKVNILYGGEHSEHGSPDSKAIVRAGELVGIETRGITHKDHLCGNEIVYYAPLAPTMGALPAVAELDHFSGAGLGVSWTTHGKRSAFVGSFAR